MHKLYIYLVAINTLCVCGGGGGERERKTNPLPHLGLEPASLYNHAAGLSV